MQDQYETDLGKLQVFFVGGKRDCTQGVTLS